MFGQLGLPEMMVIMVIALLIFGPKKLPSLGKSLGEGITSFKKAMTFGEKEAEKEEKKRRRMIPRPEPKEKVAGVAGTDVCPQKNVNLVKIRRIDAHQSGFPPRLISAGVTCFRGNDRIATTWIYRHSGQA